MSKKQFTESTSVFDFDLVQLKQTYDDWITAFENSIRKRASHTTEKIFVGLSSGYDSGAIVCELLKQKVSFKTFSILGSENYKILEKRLSLIPHEKQIISLNNSAFQEAKNDLLQRSEKFKYQIFSENNIHVTDDDGAVGLSYICSLAKQQSFLIHLSGAGADEIISDYGSKGKKLYPQSCFGGNFPKDLRTVFPWRNFYEGTQLSYLGKEEVVAGTHRIETRYPFLDKYLVQEFLHLDCLLKNKCYKAPLEVYLTQNHFPFQADQKIGFQTKAINLS